MSDAAPSTLKRDIAGIYGLGLLFLCAVIAILVVGLLEWTSTGGKGPPPVYRRLFLPRHGTFHGLTIDLPLSLGLEPRNDRLYIWRRWPAYRAAHMTTFAMLVHADSAGFGGRQAVQDSNCVHGNAGCTIDTGPASPGERYTCGNYRGDSTHATEPPAIIKCHLDAAAIFAVVSCGGLECTSLREVVVHIFATWRPDPTP